MIIKLNHNYLLSIAVFLVLGFSIPGLIYTDTYLVFNQVLVVVLELLFLLALGILYKTRQRRISHLSIVVFWTILFTNLHILPMFIAARLAGPFQDSILAAWDQKLGFNIVAITESIRNWPMVEQSFRVIYNSLIVFLLVSLFVPTLFGDLQVPYKFVIALVISAAIGMFVFAFFPAQGPWVFFKATYLPTLSDTANAIITNVKKTGPYTIDLNYNEGLIFFPSFHCIIALLCGYNFSDLRYLKWIGFIWAWLITISTLITGTHYVVDVLAAVIIVNVCLFLAQIISNLVDWRIVNIKKKL